MTRETKIGLLVGLGFIVIFAVLLAHTGSGPPAADRLPMVMGSRSGTDRLPKGLTDPMLTSADRLNAPLSDEALTEFTVTGSRHGFPMQTSDDPRAEPELSSGEDELPQPDVFNPLPDNWYKEASEDTSTEVVTAPPADSPRKDIEESRRVGPVQMVTMHRIAPEPVVTMRPEESIASPEPGERPGAPAQSVAPELALADAREAPPERTAPGAAGGTGTPANDGPDQPVHVVAKGETLGEIATKVYGTVKALDFLFESNRDRLKDKHVVIAGQTLITPELPPDAFEPVGDFTPTDMSGNIRQLTTAELRERTLADSGRQAPVAVKSDRSPPAGTRETPASPHRLYTLQPKDTYSSVARSELGSETLWPEIQRLNPDLDPKRLQPGTTIKLPAARPLKSAVASGGRPSS